PAILERLAAYHRDFKAAAEGALAVAAEVKRLSSSYAAIQPTIQSLVDSALADMNASRAEADQINETSGRILFMVMVAGFAGMVIIGFFLAHSIYAPITALTDTTTRMAEGELTLTVPGVGRRDEIGKMAVAMEVFRETALKARQMAARQTAEDRRNRRKVQNHIKGVHAAAMASLAETATGFCVG
ncbi:MAG: HAMP domain-containing protein, partial [Rhodospirillaceae bacterium]|nr:HAMP domain-containing protein [Rhodospirillaceae bacterium]